VSTLKGEKDEDTYVKLYYKAVLSTYVVVHLSLGLTKSLNRQPLEPFLM
jgi:hypothetical protein